MVIAQGEIWWADLGPAFGSAPASTRPLLVVQSDLLNGSRIATVVCVPLTTNTAWADAPGNALLDTDVTGLPKTSVANVSQILTCDKRDLRDRVGKIPTRNLELIFSGLDIVLGR